MNGIGAILKQVRVERHITLEEIEEATKIRVKYLQAIENEQFDLLPGAVYAKGFVNTYIRYLNIGDRPDVVEIMQRAATVAAAAASQPAQEEAVPERSTHRSSRQAARTRLEDKPITSKKYLIIGISIVAIVALLAIQTLYNRQRPADNDNDLLPPDQMADTVDPDTENGPDDGQAEEPEVKEPPKPTYTGVNLQLEIIDLSPSAVDKCWMTVSADGKTVFTETLSEGAAKTITAEQSIYIKAGNSGVVKLTLNGQDLGAMGEKGQVVERTFTLEDVSAQRTTSVTQPEAQGTPVDETEDDA